MSTSAVIAGLVTVAAIHWAQVVPTIKDTPYLGTAFLVLTLACLALAAILLVSDLTVVWLSVGIVNAFTVGGYIFTRTVSSFFDDQDVGHWSDTLGMVALLIEALLILLSTYRVRQAKSHNRRQVDVRPPTEAEIRESLHRDSEHSWR